MRTNNEGIAMTRVATVGFSPPPRLNLPSSISYTDIDLETGERSKVLVKEAPASGPEQAVFDALMKIALIELAHRLNVDCNNPPAWVPSVDEAYAANTRVTEGELYDRIVADGSEEDDVAVETHEVWLTPQSTGDAVAVGQIHDLPRLFSAISIAFEKVEREDGLGYALVSPVETARDEIVDSVLRRVAAPLESARRLFVIDDKRGRDLAKLRLCVSYLRPEDNARPMGDIEDLTVATCIAWVTNLVTSIRFPEEKRVGFWFCDAGGERLSETIALDIDAGEDGVKFDLALSADLGHAELQKMGRALEHLVEYWGMVASRIDG